MNNASIRAILQDLKNSIAKLEAALEIDSSDTKENTPWYPPEDPKFGPWIQFTGTDCPVDGDVVVEWLTAEEVKSKFFCGANTAAKWLCWGGADIIAYRIKK